MRARALALTFAMGLTGCHRPPADSLWLVVINKTGADLHNFTLDYGEGTLSYEIFTNGFTFAEWAAVHGEQAMHVRYTDGVGTPTNIALERNLVPDLIGGSVFVTFLPSGRIALSAHWP